MKVLDIIWELLVIRITGRATKEDDTELRSLLKDDPSLKRAFNTIERSHFVWNTKVIDNRRDNVWEKIEQGIQKEKSRLRIVRMWRYAAAACISLIAIGGFTLSYLTKDSEMIIAMNTEEEARFITLPDSSEVWLGKGSKIEYPENMKTGDRTVSLEGKAYFHVRKDNGKKFKVLTDIGEVTVLGTRFDITKESSENTMEVVLEEGSVRLEGNGRSEEVILKPGEMGIVKVNDGIKVKDVNAYLYTAWKDEYLNIESLPLKDVVFMLEQRYDTHIVIGENSLRDEVLSGRFGKELSLEDVFHTLGFIISIQWEKKPDGSYLLTPCKE